MILSRYDHFLYFVVAGLVLGDFGSAEVADHNPDKGRTASLSGITGTPAR